MMANMTASLAWDLTGGGCHGWSHLSGSQEAKGSDGLQLSKASLSDPPTTKVLGPTYLNSTMSWGLGVEIQEPVGESVHIKP